MRPPTKSQIAYATDMIKQLGYDLDGYDFDRMNFAEMQELLKELEDERN
jgi:hypothetical protein